MADGEAYDGFVASAGGGHFSQMRSWAKVATAARHFTPSYFLARRDGRVVGAALILQTKLRRFLSLPIAKIERGPVCADPDHLPDVLHSLLGETRRRGIMRLSVMPYWSGKAKTRAEQLLKASGFSDSQGFNGSHTCSLRLDITRLPEGDLFAGRKLHQVRQNIRRAERAGAVARLGKQSDLVAFRDMHEQRMCLEGKTPPGAAWYAALGEYFLAAKQRGAMFVCQHEGRMVSAVFVARHGKLATYILGASSGEDLHFPKMILPMANAIAWAKQNGIESFDLGGIPMAGDKDAKRTSIAEFKRSFSRTEISFVHQHVRWF